MRETYDRINSLDPEKKKMFIQRLMQKKNSNQAKTVIPKRPCCCGDPSGSNLKVGNSCIESISCSPMTYSQEGVWLIGALEKSYRFTLSASIIIKGIIDIEKFKKAVTSVVHRHEALRTVISTDMDEPVQVIKPIVDVDIGIVDFRNVIEEKDELIDNYIMSEARSTFDLEKGPLYKFSLLQSDNETSIFILTFHHLISDEGSFGIFVNDLLSYYQSYLTVCPTNLPELSIQFPDYSYWKRKFLSSATLEKETEYWKGKLTGNLIYLRLPMASKSDWNKYTGKYHYIVLEDAEISKFKKICIESGATLFMGFFTIFNILLYRMVGQQDIIIGTPVTGRVFNELENLIGFFVNMTLIRTNVAGEKGFFELLQQIRKTILEAFSNVTLPFEKLAKEIKLDRNLINLPYHITFNYIESKRERIECEGVIFEPLQYTKSTVTHNLGLFIEKMSGKYYCAFSYKDDLFEESTINQFAVCFERIIKVLVSQPDQAIIDLSLEEDTETVNINTAETNDKFDFT